MVLTSRWIAGPPGLVTVFFFPTHRLLDPGRDQLSFLRCGRLLASAVLRKQFLRAHPWRRVGRSRWGAARARGARGREILRKSRKKTPRCRPPARHFLSQGLSRNTDRSTT